MSDQIIITLPLKYTSVVKPAQTAFESLATGSWGAETGSPSKQRLLVTDNRSALKQIVDQVNETYLSYGIITILNEFRISDEKLTASIIGTANYKKEIDEIRQLLLRAYHPIVSSEIVLTPVCFDFGVTKRELTQFLLQVTQYLSCSIWITDQGKLVVVGQRSAVKAAENKIRLKIDSMSQLFTDYLELESVALAPLVAGPELVNMKRIISQANCNIYLPDLLHHLGNLQEPPRIYITGLRALVLQAKSAIAQIITIVSKEPFTKQISILPLKRQMLTINSLQLFDELMYETGCYFEVPPLGSKPTSLSGDKITFQGNSVEEVDNVVDEFVKLLTELVSSKCELTTATYAPADVNKFLNFCDTLSSNSGLAVTAVRQRRGYTVQTMGSADAVNAADKYMSQLSMYLDETVTRAQVQVQIELPNKERDFIAGKKNGKLVKVANMSSSTVQLLPFTENNFLVEMTSTSLSNAAVGLQLLSEEFPRSTTFNIPESFHRQIIGVGGQTIQTIMRRYNVFIKFTNSFELGEKSTSQHVNFQQGFARKNNVIIKCPAKNKSQIPLARNELERLVEQVAAQGGYMESHVTLSGPQWRLMTSPKFNQSFNEGKKKPTNFITELEKQSSCYIRFPTQPAGYSPVVLTVCGPETEYQSVVEDLQKLAPYAYELGVEKSGKLAQLKQALEESKAQNALQLSFLENVVVPLRMLFNIELQVDQDKVLMLFYPGEFDPESPRLKLEQQVQVVKNQYSKALTALKFFLKEIRIGVHQEGIKELGLPVETGASTEKENVGLKYNEKIRVSQREWLPSYIPY